MAKLRDAANEVLDTAVTVYKPNQRLPNGDFFSAERNAATFVSHQEWLMAEGHYARATFPYTYWGHTDVDLAATKVCTYEVGPNLQSGSTAIELIGGGTTGAVESATFEFNSEDTLEYNEIGNLVGRGSYIAQLVAFSESGAIAAYEKRNGPIKRKGAPVNMWLTLIVMVVSFLMTKSSTGDTKKATLAAGLAGAGTAFVTSQTDWGQGLNTDFNTAFGLDDSWTGFSGGTDVNTTPSNQGTDSASGTTKPGTLPSSGSGGGAATGLWTSLPTWLKGGAAAGGTAWALSSVPEWVWWVGGAALIWFFFFKE